MTKSNRSNVETAIHLAMHHSVGTKLSRMSFISGAVSTETDLTLTSSKKAAEYLERKPIGKRGSQKHSNEETALGQVTLSSPSSQKDKKKKKKSKRKKSGTLVTDRNDTIRQGYGYNHVTKLPLSPPPQAAESNRIRRAPSTDLVTNCSPSWSALAWEVPSIPEQASASHSLATDDDEACDIFSVKDTSSTAHSFKSKHSRSSAMNGTQQVAQPSLTLSSSARDLTRPKRPLHYFRQDSGLSEITLELADFNSPYGVHTSSAVKIETIAEESRRNTTESSLSLFFPSDLPLSDLNDHCLIAESTRGKCMSLSTDGSLTLDSRTFASSSLDDDTNWKDFIHLGRKITTGQREVQKLIPTRGHSCSEWETLRESSAPYIGSEKGARLEQSILKRAEDGKHSVSQLDELPERLSVSEWSSTNVAPTISQLQPKAAAIRNGDLEKWTVYDEEKKTKYSSSSEQQWGIFARLEDGILLGSSHEKWEMFDDEKDEKWECFKEEADDGAFQSEETLFNESKLKRSAPRMSPSDFKGIELGTMASVPTSRCLKLEESASQQLVDAAIDKKAQQLLAAYLQSIGTSKTNAEDISSEFLERRLARQAEGILLDEDGSAVSDLGCKQLASLYPKTLRSITRRPDGTACAFLADLTWNRTDVVEPLKCRPKTEFQQIFDEEQGLMSLSPETHFVKARAVQETDEASAIVYADSSPLSTRHLLQEKGVRRIIALACIIVAIIVGAVSGVLLNNERTDDQSIGEVGTVHKIYPTTAPTIQPNFILNDILERAAELSGWEAVDTSGSPHRKAVTWLSSVDQLNTTSELGPAFIQRYAMVVTYFSMGGGEWYDKQLWLDPTVNECEWGDNIGCNQSSKAITGIDLARNNVQGTIPHEISLLESIMFLRVSQNEMLSGPIPNTLWGMTRIGVFEASNCQLTGTISNAIENLQSLIFLGLNNNALHGTVPNTMFMLPALRTINLSTNYFTGTLSSDLKENQEIERLSITDNFLSGFLPDFGNDLDVLPQLGVLHFDRNDFTGTLPIWLTSHAARVEVTASGNRFGGTISTEPDGSNSSALPPITSLRLIDFSDNELTGRIPSSFGRISSLQTLRLGHNQLTGQLPQIDTFSPNGRLWAAIKTFEVGHNVITGSISNMSPTLEVLDVSHNRMKGDLIESLCESCPSIKSLKISHNPIRGPVARCFRCWEKLEVLEASNCQLTGALPSILPSKLEMLAVANNILTGTLPLEMGSLRRLVNLTLVSNRMTGVIPSELGNASNLERLDLRDNVFSGTLPQSLSKLTHLAYLGVVGNQMEGTVPVCNTAVTFKIDNSIIGCSLECSCCVGACDSSNMTSSSASANNLN